MKTIVLMFTRSFPYYSLENCFLQHEVQYLKKEFENLIILPSLTTGDQQKFDFKIIIENRFAKFLHNYKNIKAFYFIKSLFSLSFFKEFLSTPSTLIKPYRLFQLINSLSYALYVKKWISEYIKTENFQDDNIIIYTYWFTSLTSAFGLLKKKHKNIVLITRAHGADLYEERKVGYFPLRAQTLAMLDKLFFISKHGFDYATSKYPRFSIKFKLAELGVPDPRIISKPSQDNIFRIVSCSSLIKVKRVELLFEGLIEFAKNNINRKIIWTHFGDGVLRNTIKLNTESISLENFEAKIMGFVQNNELLNYYKNSPVDVFINVSQSEGKPVTIMEAQSFGIPVIGTSVGGIPEIVNDKNGILLSANPTDNEIAKALDWFLYNPKEALKKRVYARSNWMLKCNADINFASFASDLKKLTFK